LNGVPLEPTEFLGWKGAPPPFDLLPLSIVKRELGAVSAGDFNEVLFEAEGQTGGCDEGSLPFWEGRMTFCW
jgi:hypothetical protein